ncbi:unnamed protein product, partial [Tetraodon nigroviridis]
VAGAYSKTWVYRESAILNVYKKLLDLSPNTSKEDLRNTIRAAVFLVNRALLDKVSPVFLASLKLLWLLLSQLLPGLGRAEMNRCLEQTWPSLLARVGGRRPTSGRPSLLSYWYESFLHNCNSFFSP